MTTIEKRVTELERVLAGTGRPLMLFVHQPPTDGERHRIEEAERIGQKVIQVSWQDAEL